MEDDRNGLVAVGDVVFESRNLKTDLFVFPICRSNRRIGRRNGDFGVIASFRFDFDVVCRLGCEPDLNRQFPRAFVQLEFAILARRALDGECGVFTLARRNDDVVHRIVVFVAAQNCQKTHQTQSITQSHVHTLNE